MGAIAAVVGGLLGAAASAAVAIAATIVSTVAAVIAPVVASVSSIIGTVAGAVAGTVGQVVTSVAATVKTITTKLSAGIQDIGELISRTTKPILEPIKAGWETIHDYIETIKAGISDKLEPLVDVMDVVNTVRDVKILGKILTGSEGIAKVVRYAKDAKLLDMAAAISTTYEMIAGTVTGILERAEADRKTFEEKITYIDRGMRSLIELTQLETLDTVYRKVRDVAGELASAITSIDTKVAAIGRRTTDLPWFQEMLLRALP